jgi:hypothetical protein
MKRLLAAFGGVAMTLAAQADFFPEKLIVTNGYVMSGGLSSLEAVDGDSLYIMPFFYSKYGPVTLELQAVAVGRPSDELTFELNACQMSEVGYQKVELYDFAAGTWVKVFQQVFHGQTSQLSITVYWKQFVDPASNRTRARITWHDSGWPTKYIQVNQASWRVGPGK